MQRTIHLSAEVKQEGRIYVALCIELDIASQGSSVEEAFDNLDRAIKLWLDTASAKEIERRLPPNHPPKVYRTCFEVPYGQAASPVGV